MILKNFKNFITNLYLIINNIWESFLYLSVNKRCIFLFALTLFFYFKLLKFLLLSLVLILLFLEFILLLKWSYKFYCFYLTNQYYCLDLNYIFHAHINKSFFGCFYLYIKIGAFRKFYFIIKKKEISILNVFILIIIFSLHIPVRSILLIYNCIKTFNIAYFLECKKKKKLKHFFSFWMRRMCYTLSDMFLIEDKSKIEIFNKKIYY